MGAVAIKTRVYRHGPPYHGSEKKVSIFFSNFLKSFSCCFFTSGVRQITRPCWEGSEIFPCQRLETKTRDEKLIEIESQEIEFVT